MSETTTVYDPPGGWRYGFPRPYTPLEGETLAETLLRDGYPQSELDRSGGATARFWDSVDREYVDRDTTQTETFGPLPAPPEPRKGAFLQTYSGREFWPLDSRPHEVHIEDIAHALAHQCRFGGHCIRFYSVAEHSVLVARWLMPRYGRRVALWGLLHDGAEAYVADVPRPLKAHLAGYKAAEADVQAAISERFNLPPEMPAAVHEADNRILADEIRQNMRPMSWHARHDNPLGVTLEFWEPERAEDEMLLAYWTLTREGKT